MRRRDRFLSILFVLALVGAIKLGQQLYRYYAYDEERLEIARLEENVEREGLGVILTHLRADSLRREIEAADAVLESERRALDRLERRISFAQVDTEFERSYREGLTKYNERVRRRNEQFGEWRRTVENNHAHVRAYNELVDSIRSLAAAIGEPYYPILTPAEIAALNGTGPPGE